jgi:prevent-host-death family protein
METMSISSFKAQCLAVLDRVAKTGQPVLITRRGEPIAEVVPPGPKPTRGNWLGHMRDVGSPSAADAYDAPLWDEAELVKEWDELEAETGKRKGVSGRKRKADL